MTPVQQIHDSGAARTSSTLPGMPLRPWANVRLALTSGWCLWTLFTAEQLDYFTLLAPFCLIFAITDRIIHWRFPDEPTHLIYISLIIDLLIFAALVYHKGSCSTWLVFLAAPFVAGHALNSHRGTGRTALVGVWLGLLVVVVLEARGVLPARPGGPASLGPHAGLSDYLSALWLAVVPPTGIYFIMRAAVLRIRSFVKLEREHADAERSAQERTRTLERRLLEAERFESLGRMAGGVAHDFNNILTGILGFTHCVHQELPEGDKHREDLELVIGAAERAGSLTEQLLTFSRKQVIQPRPVELNQCVEQLKRMLDRIIGEDIVFTVDLDEDVAYIKADVAQLEQVLVNLVINARDAMPEGGDLALSSSRVTLDGQAVKDLDGIEPGDYARLMIRDSGEGMTPEIAQKIFDPFFTTKPPGKGTGLGLATVLGIVKQNGGEIHVSSRPGEGTTFTIHWPLTEAPPAPSPSAAVVVPAGKETVLLVEDEEIVRQLTRRLLEEAGYTVIEAPDGAKALELLDTHQGRVDLLLTDVVMPGIQGDRLAELVRERIPKVGVLFMSGYAQDSVGGALESGENFLAKPFTLASLLKAARQALDGK